MSCALCWLGQKCPTCETRDTALAAVRAVENRAIKAEARIAELEKEREELTFIGVDLRNENARLRAALEPTEENVQWLAFEWRSRGGVSTFVPPAAIDDVRAILAAILKRAESNCQQTTELDAEGK